MPSSQNYYNIPAEYQLINRVLSSLAGAEERQMIIDLRQT